MTETGTLGRAFLTQAAVSELRTLGSGLAAHSSPHPLGDLDLYAHGQSEEVFISITVSL